MIIIFLQFCFSYSDQIIPNFQNLYQEINYYPYYDKFTLDDISDGSLVLTPFGRLYENVVFNKSFDKDVFQCDGDYYKIGSYRLDSEKKYRIMKWSDEIQQKKSWIVVNIQDIPTGECSTLVTVLENECNNIFSVKFFEEKVLLCNGDYYRIGSHISQSTINADKCWLSKWIPMDELDDVNSRNVKNTWASLSDFSDFPVGKCYSVDESDRPDQVIIKNILLNSYFNIDFNSNLQCFYEDFGKERVSVNLFINDNEDLMIDLNGIIIYPGQEYDGMIFYPGSSRGAITLSRIVRLEGYNLYKDFICKFDPAIFKCQIDSNSFYNVVYDPYETSITKGIIPILSPSPSKSSSSSIILKKISKIFKRSYHKVFHPFSNHHKILNINKRTVDQVVQGAKFSYSVDGGFYVIENGGEKVYCSYLNE